MIRTVPETTGEGIELYIRTYYSLLRSSGDIRIRSLEETHEGMLSSLHLKAESAEFDASAFTLRGVAPAGLPPSGAPRGDGPSGRGVRRGTACAISRPGSGWMRRRGGGGCFSMGRRPLAAFVSSVSDIDDLIPCLTAFQIEWNKLHWRLTGTQLGHDLAEGRRAGIDGRGGSDRGARHHRRGSAAAAPGVGAALG